MKYVSLTIFIGIFTATNLAAHDLPSDLPIHYQIGEPLTVNCGGLTYERWQTYTPNGRSEFEIYSLTETDEPIIVEYYSRDGAGVYGKYDGNWEFAKPASNAHRAYSIKHAAAQQAEELYSYRNCQLWITAEEIKNSGGTVGTLLQQLIDGMTSPDSGS